MVRLYFYREEYISLMLLLMVGAFSVENPIYRILIMRLRQA